VLQLRSERQVAAQASAVVPVPEIADAADALRPVPERELSSVAATPQIPGLRREQTPPAYVPPQVIEGEPSPGPPAPARAPAGRPADDYGAPQIEGLVDSRVKRQTNVAAFALLAIVALAVIVYFGAT
jgi:hypothetical protein